VLRKWLLSHWFRKRANEIMQKTELEFRVNSDRDLRIGLRHVYFNAVYGAAQHLPIVIRLPATEWISANGLNMLLIFVESVLRKHPETRIFVEAIGPEVVKMLDEVGGGRSDLVEAVYQKLIFYEAMDFFTRLRCRDVVVWPQKSTCDALSQRLGALKKERQFLYSSRILALSPLIDNVTEQFALTARIRTLGNILTQNLRGRIERNEVEEASAQIMFELVKNIYQHSEVPRLGQASQGFACAQINRRPLFGDEVLPDALVKSVLEHVRKPTSKKLWKYLSITIADYGVGLSNKLSEYFNDKCRDTTNVEIGRFNISRKNLSDHALMIEIAATTDFSTKMVRRSTGEDQSENWADRIKLAARGYGLVYCLAFIAKHFGRINIRSGPVSFSIFPKPTTPLQRELLENVGEFATSLQHRFNELFIAQAAPLSITEQHFPGTQILLEIPVETFFEGK
jgi:hypothetical protein